MKQHFFRAALSAALSLALLTPAVPAAAPEAQQGRFDGYIVGLREGVSTASLLSDDAVVSGGHGFIVVEHPGDAESIPREDIAYIEPNYLVELLGAEGEPGTDLPQPPAGPNDPLYQEYQWNLQMIHAMDAWNAGLTGKDVLVGFVDSGVRATHEDLNTGAISGENMLNDGGDFTDTVGHGTFSFGIVGAQTDNGRGLAGMAPGVRLRAYRVFSGKTTSMSNIVNGIDRAVEDGCRIINMSLGSKSSSVTLRQAVERAQAAGAVLVAAVGNEGSGVSNYPAAFNGVIGVGSVDRTGERSKFSNQNDSVDFVAPAGGIAGLGHKRDTGYLLQLDSPGNSGTSYAAPAVTALAAIALEYDSALTPEGVYTLLKNSASDLGTPGRDKLYGEGLIDGAGFVRELKRPYTITYETDGGTLPEGAMQTYEIRDGALPLPVPEKEGFLFAGWSETAEGGTPLTELPAGAVGDLTLYALWQPESVAALESLAVRDYPARLQEDGSYLAILPYGSDIAAVTAEEISAVPVLPGARVTLEAAAPDRWTVRVEADLPAVQREFSLRLAVSSLHVKAEAAAQTGTATPASLDGLTAAVPFSADAAPWFQLGEEAQLPEDFAAAGEIVTGRGTLTAEGSTFTYTPAPQDADSTVTLRLRGVSDGVPTPDGVTVELAVGSLPGSTPVFLTEEPVFDRWTDSALTLEAALYGRDIESVLWDGTPLEPSRYTLSGTPQDALVKLTLPAELLKETDAETHTLCLTFAGGIRLETTIAVTNSIPHFTVTFLDGEKVYHQLADITPLDVIKLPKEPKKSGFAFRGWFTAPEGGELFYGGVTLEEGLTLYAQWEKKAAPPPVIGGGGGGGIVLPEPEDTETTKNPDGSVTTVKTNHDTGTVTETTVFPDGSETAEERRTDGTRTITMKRPDGASSATEADAEGRMKTAVTLPKALCAETVKNGTVLSVPMPPVAAAEGREICLTIESEAPVELLLPMEHPTAGTVAVLRGENGEEQVLRKSTVEKNGVRAALCGAVTLTLSDRTLPFADVQGHWASDAIAFVSSHGLFAGTSKSTFQPEQKMSRAMLVRVLHNLEGNPAPKGEAAFCDVPGGSWYTDAVLWAAEEGLVSGTGGGRFRPDDAITREQLAVILYHHAGSPAAGETARTFPDSDSVSGYARAALSWAVRAGIVGGKGDGTLDPKGLASRAEVAVMLARYCNSSK